MGEFYLRRAQRILPNIVLTVLAVLFIWMILMPPSTARMAADHGIWTLFGLSNFYILKVLGGYWGNAAGSSPLTHTWSLGVEEQFYLLFPGSLLLLARFEPGRVRLWLVVAMACSFGLCLQGTRTHPVATFYLLPTRVWELLIGAALGAYLTPLRANEAPLRVAPGVVSQEIIGLAGLGMVVLGFVFINDGSGFPGLVSLAPTVGTTLVLLSVIDQKTRLSRLLSSSFMVRTGKLSYSIYLWHWPLITLGKSLATLYGKTQLLGSVTGGIVGVVLAWCAYVAIESPLRRRGSGRRRRFAVIAISFLIANICCIAVTSRRPVADPAHLFDPVIVFAEQYTAAKAVGAKGITQSTMLYDVYLPPIPPDRPNDLWRTGGVIHSYGGGDPQSCSSWQLSRANVFKSH